MKNHGDFRRQGVDAATSKAFPILVPLPARPSSSTPTTFKGLAQVLTGTLPPHCSPFLALLHIWTARVPGDHLAQPLVFWWSCRWMACLRLLLFLPWISCSPYCHYHPWVDSMCSLVSLFRLCALKNPKSMASSLKAVYYTHLCVFPCLAQNSTHKPLNKWLIIQARLLLKYLEDNLFRDCSHVSVFWGFRT